MIDYFVVWKFAAKRRRNNRFAQTTQKANNTHCKYKCYVSFTFFYSAYAAYFVKMFTAWTGVMAPRVKFFLFYFHSFFFLSQFSGYKTKSTVIILCAVSTSFLRLHNCFGDSSGSNIWNYASITNRVTTEGAIIELPSGRGEIIRISTYPIVIINSERGRRNSSRMQDESSFSSFGMLYTVI